MVASSSGVGVRIAFNGRRGGGRCRSVHACAYGPSGYAVPTPHPSLMARDRLLKQFLHRHIDALIAEARHDLIATCHDVVNEYVATRADAIREWHAAVAAMKERARTHRHMARTRPRPTFAPRRHGSRSRAPRTARRQARHVARATSSADPGESEPSDRDDLLPLARPRRALRRARAPPLPACSVRAP